MSEVWFARGASQAEFDAGLTALHLQDKPRTPLLIVATGDATPRLILASRALFALFDTDTADALTNRLLQAGDPGAQRLGALCRKLALDGAPRLERLRFILGGETTSLTFLCRRVLFAGEPVFIAAALGLRGDLIGSSRGPVAEHRIADASMPNAPFENATVPPPLADVLPPDELDLARRTADVRARWPKGRSQRFLWQCDVAFRLTEITPILRDIVGAANADLIGRRLTDLAPVLDPGGALAAALARRETWSGIDDAWPIADVPAAVAATLGAIPIGAGAEDFGGYRGYGVLYLDRVVAHQTQRLSRDEAPAGAEPTSVRTLSPQEQATFAALRGELREAALIPSTPHQPAHPSDRRQDDIARHGLNLLDRLGVGVIVARGDVPIFANRHVLDTFGFADEDALHAVGGLAYLIVDPVRPRGGETTAMRHRDGRVIETNARMQTMEWDGLPAALVTLQTPATASEPAPRPIAPIGGDPGEAHELRAILDTATDGVAVIDGDGNVLSLNRSGEALFGCDRGTVIGRPFLSLFAADNQVLAAEYMEGLRSNATRQLLNDGREILISAHRGGTTPVFMTLGRLGRSRLGSLSASAEAPRFCALFRDLTHWKKVERDLEAARAEAERINAVKADCLSKISADVRGPLTKIVDLAASIEERSGPAGDDRSRDEARKIHETGSHMLRLVDELTDQAKVESVPAASPVDAVEPIDANRIIRECVGLMQPQASSARVILRLSLSPALPKVRADAAALRQIVLNLLSNAVTFNEPGGQAIVATQIQDSGHVVLRIRDTGRGMSDAEVSAALQAPDHEADGPTDPASAGSILSLPLTKALIEANKGTFSIRSKVHQGTLVEVAFPPTRVLAD